MQLSIAASVFCVTVSIIAFLTEPDIEAGLSQAEIQARKALGIPGCKVPQTPAGLGIRIGVGFSRLIASWVLVLVYLGVQCHGFLSRDHFLVISGLLLLNL